MNLQPIDQETLRQRGIAPERLEEELQQLATGFPYLEIISPATPGNGILVPSEEEKEQYISAWNEYLAQGGYVMKMVPASGAASRMFKNLFAFAQGESQVPDTDFMHTFCNGIANFAFYPELQQTVGRLYNATIEELFQAGRHRDVVRALILPEGMNYGQLPKALLTFHRAAEGNRAALEEHLAEGAQYAASNDGIVRVHFTVSPDHIEIMKAKLQEAGPRLEKKYGVRFEVSMSVQKPSTDTVASNLDGTPYREDGHLFFRPGGHGALIENLNDLEGDTVFIKNIDNVVPDSLRASTIEYKKLIGGVLVSAKAKIEHYARLLEEGLPSRPVLDEMAGFLRDTLFITDDGASEMDDLELADYLWCKLNRPLRVCGMVRNEGEPGGGPFIARNPDGTASPQILESSQIDPANEAAMAMLRNSTHFNPVDLVVYKKDLQGRPFDLRQFVDPSTGFISTKSRKGTEIKALELPGLWNGAMSDWNTIFVEVPGSTFNPVKTVNDLLRPAHQD